MKFISKTRQIKLLLQDIKVLEGKLEKSEIENRKISNKLEKIKIIIGGK